MESKELSNAIYRALAKAIYLGAAVFLICSFLDAISVIVLFFLIAVIFAVGLSPVVNWLETKRVPRLVGTLALLIALAGIGGGILALVIPRIANEMEHILENSQRYGQAISQRAEALIGKYPALEETLNSPKVKDSLTDFAATLIPKVGRFSLTAIGLLLGLLVLTALIAYMLAMPRPLLRGLVYVFPAPMRDRVAQAYAQASNGIVSWVWANMLIGAIEGIATAVFLSVMGIPGAVTWGVVTFFAELIPQLGSYLMAIPPLLVTLAVDPSMVWAVLLWYIALQQFVNNVLAPPIRASAMQIHPVSEIFMVLALSLAFGVLGAIIASPAVVIVKSIYGAFYAPAKDVDNGADQHVEAMLSRRLPA